jgi:hypothetical protein
VNQTFLGRSRYRSEAEAVAFDPRNEDFYFAEF